MKPRFLIAMGLAVLLVFAPGARAGQVTFSFSGAGVSGSGTLTFGTDTVSGDPGGAYAVTGISGTFSDANLGIINAAITGLMPINPGAPRGAPFPASLSIYSATNPYSSDPSLSYDNLYYADGSPITCPNYPKFGGYLDIYGVMFTLSNGDAVDLWSNGGIPGVVPVDYGAAVVNVASDTVVDYRAGAVQMAVPEPGSVGLLAIGLIGALAWCRRQGRPRSHRPSA